MDRPESLSHSLWVCKYHVVFIPKCRRRTLYVPLRRHLGEVFATGLGKWRVRLRGSSRVLVESKMDMYHLNALRSPR